MEEKSSRFVVIFFRIFTDRDADEQLTEDEFADLPADGVGLELVDQDQDKQRKIGGSDDRRKEFRFLIDKNKNGKADRTELLVIITLAIR